VDRIPWQGREVRLGVFPMGVDAAAYAALADSPAVAERAAAARVPGEQLLLGIDRLDYTKGIPRRLLAYEALLRREPALRGRVRLVQVAVPSRENVGAYRELRDEVDALVGRLHGEFATPTWAPVLYLHRGLAPEEVAALYRAADVLLVTPLRDGMNLVAKEFVAARTDGDGVLVLSEFAGAAAELSEALLVNPYDLEATAAALARALAMEPEERRARMAALRARVTGFDVHRWARSFVERLASACAAAEPALRPSPPAALDEVVRRAAAADALVLLLDYDGTLVPFARTPDLARPDPALRDLLRALAATPGTRLHVVSGRQRDALDRWLGALPLSLHAEHGLWSRFAGGPWEAATISGPDAWRDPVREILREFAERTPGSLVEEKTHGFAWHHRAADPEWGAAQAKELSLHLATLLANAPVELLPGDHVLEVRPFGVDKGLAARAAAAAAPEGALLLAVGDDRTDEDLFAALPPGGIAVHVGPAPSRAAFRIADVGAVRALLSRIARERAARGEATVASPP
jgi:trehalose 6-phosphate synthase/phosphatase